MKKILTVFCASMITVLVLTGCVPVPQAEENETETPILEQPVMREISLYYYNEIQDKDETGNAMCSENAVLPVNRKIAESDKIIEDTLNLLLKGELSQVEKDQGFSTEYPLPGFSLKTAVLTDGKLTLEFDDMQNKTGGGSCRVGILWNQIKKTAMQFPEVKEVVFIPEELFQP
ncbi:GerMN domain-containing protein [Candidatus Peregrinibacteria bacterium]|nr:GerMN domain-containing protein [Candidatus Peregrinibacteria bacterium]